MKDHDWALVRLVMRALGRTSSRGTSSDRECFLMLVGKPSAEVPIHTTA